jgi:hypothetical protein
MMTDNLPEVQPAPFLALPPPERIAPEQIPRDAGKFRAWADRVCIEWPPALTIAAFNAAYGLTKGSDADLKAFIALYSQWWALSEIEKFAMMTEDQRESRTRKDDLRIGRQTARGL